MALEAAIAEFSALREEIGYRSRFQHLLINLNVVSTGTLGGVSLARAGNENLLLLVAAISSALGLLYADHSRSIVFLARYIDQELRAPDGSRLFRWESRSKLYESRRPRVYAFRLSLFLVFVIPPVIALSLLLAQDGYWNSFLRETAWLSGATLTVLMAITIMTTPLKPEKEVETQRLSPPPGSVSKATLTALIGVRALTTPVKPDIKDAGTAP